MANFVHDSFRNGILGEHATRVDLDTDTIGMIFIDATDDIPLVTDDFFDDLTGTPVPLFASAPSLASITIGSPQAEGVFDAADLVFTSLTGDECEWLVMFKDTGTEGTSDMICAWDTLTGLPLTPNGADVTVVMASGGILTT
jgi:hypothetical protein